VIFLGLVLARISGYSQHFVPFWAAAYIHDLSRRKDGKCHKHGKWAADEQFEKYLPLFRRAGLKPEQDESVKIAVQYHSLPEEKLNAHSKHWEAYALLKDADALDRVRLRTPGGSEIGGLNPHYLRLQHASGLISHAIKLYNLCPNANWATIWETGVSLVNPDIVLDELPDNYRDDEPPQVRAKRRAFGGYFTNRALQHEKMLESLVIPDENIISQSKIFTYCASDTYRKFKEEGVWKSLWETGPMWHFKYNDCPMECRGYNDERLYGERGTWIAHGIVSPPEGLDKSCDKRLREMYGNVRIQWKQDALKACTFCINDSQAAPYVLPLTSRNFIGTLLHNRMIGKQPVYFIEAQIHQKMSLADVAETDHGL
jgi:hypothetical protein